MDALMNVKDFPGFEPWKLNSSERVTDRTDLGDYTP